MSETIADRLARAAEEAEEAEERMERGEQARPPSHRVRPPRNPAQVYSLRMPIERLEQLRQAAANAGMSPSALMREWVLDRLDGETFTLTELVRRLVHEEFNRLLAEEGGSRGKAVG